MAKFVSKILNLNSPPEPIPPPAPVEKPPKQVKKIKKPKKAAAPKTANSRTWDTRVGFLGGGTMARALAAAFVDFQFVPASNIFAHTPNSR